ncbi:MAG: tetratricopeptide repeat protein [Desulfobaccales bacterium]|nr:tetratricopeptide repeat protein [Desulfobaccales bacterium]
MRAGIILKSRLSAALAIIILGAGLLLGGAGCSYFPFFRGHKITAAEDRFLAAIPSAKGDTTRLLHNAHYLQLLGRPELALKELEEAYQQDPNNLKVVDALARSYEELGRFESAQKLYQEALARHRANQALSNNLGFSFFLAGRWDQAEACFRQVLRRQPQNTAARNNLGLLLCRQQRFEEAHRLWQEAGGEAQALIMMSQALATLGIKEPPAYARKSPPGPAPEKQTLAMSKAREKTGKLPGSTLPAPARPRPQPFRPPPLTAPELEDTAIELRNGAGVQGLASKTRHLLLKEGFQVARIGNHLNFEAKQTVICYRPEAQKVAQALAVKFFQTSLMEQDPDLPEDVDIKVILGRGLLQPQQLPARLAALAEEED